MTTPRGVAASCCAARDPRLPGSAEELPFFDLLVPMPSRNGVARRWRCGRCGAEWEEGIQSTYDGDLRSVGIVVPVPIASPASPPRNRPRLPRGAIAAFVGFAAGTGIAVGTIGQEWSRRERNGWVVLWAYGGALALYALSRLWDLLRRDRAPDGVTGGW